MKGKHIHLLGYRIKPSSFAVFVVSALVIVATVVLVPLYLFKPIDRPETARVPDSPPEVAVAEAPPTSRVEPEVEITLGGILRQHREAAGLRGVESVLLHGSYTEDGRRFGMKLAAKAPNLVRKTMTDADFEMTCTFDGQAARLALTQGEEVTNQVLEESVYRHAIILEGAFLALASNPLADVVPQYAQDVDQIYDGQTCHTVVSHVSGYPKINHLIDAETHLESVRYLDLTVDGEVLQISIHYTDYRPNGTGQLPHAYTLKVNGTLRGQARIDSIQFNPGLMPWMFSAAELSRR